MFAEVYDDSKVPVLYGRLSQGEGEKRKESDIGFYFPLPEDVAERTLNQSGLDRSQPINFHLGEITGPEEILMEPTAPRFLQKPGAGDCPFCRCATSA